MRWDVLEATARRDEAFRAELVFLVVRFEAVDFLSGELFAVFSFVVVRFVVELLAERLSATVLAATVFFADLRVCVGVFEVRERELERLFVEEEEPFTKRTGFFARDAVVEEGFRFFDEAIGD